MSEVETITDFMCCCNEEGEQHCDEVMTDVLDRLNSSRENLLSDVVLSLNWQYDGASITGIYNDQWSVVTAVLRNKEGEVILRTRVQCDRVEDGIARTWQIFADKKKND